MQNNEVFLSGKVLSVKPGYPDLMIIKICLANEHKGEIKQSVFSTYVYDKNIIQNCPVKPGDKVDIHGHLNLDFRLSNTGKERVNLRVYVDELKIKSSTWN